MLDVPHGFHCFNYVCERQCQLVPLGFSGINVSDLLLYLYGSTMRHEGDIEFLVSGLERSNLVCWHLAGQLRPHVNRIYSCLP